MKTLKPHQQEALNDLGNGKILKGGVGSGKTLVAVAYYCARESPKPVIVITTAKKRDSLDWEEEFAAFGVGKASDATVHGVLTVDSWNNIQKYKDVRDAFFVFDEQRAVGSGAWAKSFIAIARANRWILLSATPGDGWLDLIPVFVANGLYKNRTHFLREHVIFSYHAKFPKVQRFIGEPTLERHKRRILVEMPFEKHTERVVHEIKVDYDPETLERVTEKRWNPYEEKPLRDIAEMFLVSRKVVNTDPTRLSSVQALLEKHPRLIVFYNFNYELEQLRTLKQGPSVLNHTPEIQSTSPTSTSITTSTSSSEKSRSASSNPASRSTTSPGRSSTDHTSSSTSSRPIETRTASSTSPRSTSSHSTGGRTSQTEGGSEWDSSVAESMTTDSRSSDGSMAQPISASSEMRKPGDGPTPSSARYSGMRSLPKELRSRFDSQAKAYGSSTLGSPLSQLERTQRPASTESSRPTPTTADRSTTSVSAAQRSSRENSSSEDSGSSSPSTTPGSKSDQALVVAEWNGHKHEPIPKSERWLYLVQYVAGSEGWNCIETDATAFYSLTYSYKNWEQAFGRIDRMNTPFTKLHYYVLQSDSWIDKAIRRALKAKKNFNEASFMRKKQGKMSDSSSGNS